VSVTEDTERSLGEWLRQRREELGVSLEEIEAVTRIRARYLEALEAEEFDILPDPVVGRGFLRNYAAYLELDPKDAADRFSKMVVPPEPESLPVEDSSPSTPEPFRPVILHNAAAQRLRRTWVLALLVIAAVALGITAWWGYPRVAELLARSRSAVRATATQRPVGVDLPTATYTPATTFTSLPSPTMPSPTEAPATLALSVTMTPTFTPSPPPSPSPLVYTGIFLELVFTDTSWVQVTVDGVRQFQGELEADTYRSWYGEERIELRLGNAGAVEVTVNGQNLGTLGRLRDVADRVFEKVGEQVSEATPTRAPTVEGTPTAEAATPTAPPTAAPSTAGTAPTMTTTASVSVTPTPTP
jgi:cytoskeletal protein RodZ